MLRGSLPTAIVASTTFVSVRSTDTVSSAGLTTQSSLLLADSAIGLEVVGALKTAADATDGGRHQRQQRAATG